MKRTFFGGVHPRGNKEMSTASTALTVVTPAQVAIPLQQHIGVPCRPLVAVGDRVLCGQKIGDGEGLCVPVHASVSGTVIAIEPRRHPNGQTVDAIIIQNDKNNDAVPSEGCDLPPEQLDADTVLRAIREAGIVGMGGAAFPGDIKALSALGHVDTLIANACECEPYITADDLLLRTDPQPVLDGMRLLRQLLSPERAVLAIEDNKAVAIRRLQELTADYPEIEIVVLPTRYPQGAEKQLVQAVTGRQIPPGGLPAAVGCVVFNVSTFAAITRAVRLGTPLTSRIVTVTGEAVAHPQNLIAPIGTSFADLIAAAGGLHEDADRVLNGGPMMGIAQADLSAPLVKATNAVLCLLKEKTPATDNRVCIRCGKCLGVCPMHLQPLYIARYANAGNGKQLSRLHVIDCIECGCCTFTCPAKLPLAEACRFGKKLVKEATKK